MSKWIGDSADERYSTQQRAKRKYLPMVCRPAVIVVRVLAVFVESFSSNHFVSKSVRGKPDCLTHRLPDFEGHGWHNRHNVGLFFQPAPNL
jgi:hypothetical protein